MRRANRAIFNVAYQDAVTSGVTPLLVGDADDMLWEMVSDPLMWGTWDQIGQAVKVETQWGTHA